jgi:hypothetical protein
LVVLPLETHPDDQSVKITFPPVTAEKEEGEMKEGHFPKVKSV